MMPEEELKKISSFPQAVQQLALAALLSNHFEKHDILLTVVGGAAVQYYSNAEYVTGDLDAILFGDDKQTLEKIMGNLGFKRTSSYRHFEHPLFPFVVEFPPSPIEVGSRYIDEVNILKIDQYSVRVLRVEDVIMDRIVAGVEWRDKPSLDQARLLWKKNITMIDQKYLKEFAKAEGYEATLKEIMKS